MNVKIAKGFTRQRQHRLCITFIFYEDYSELGLMNWNLVSLCNSCHNKMHNRHDDTATKLGLEWQDKKKKDFEIYFKNKNEKVRD